MQIVVLIVSTTKDGGSLAVSSFEPGQQYSISVVNSKENKGTHCWLHASEGQFHRDWSNGQATSCGNAALTYATNIEHLFEWTAPSSEECVKFSVVMASGADKPYSRSEVRSPACWHFTVGILIVLFALRPDEQHWNALQV